MKGIVFSIGMLCFFLAAMRVENYTLDIIAVVLWIGGIIVCSGIMIIEFFEQNHKKALTKTKKSDKIILEKFTH